MNTRPRRLTAEFSDETKRENISSISKYGFIVKCRAANMTGFGSRIMLGLLELKDESLKIFTLFVLLSAVEKLDWHSSPSICMSYYFL
jgi:hypothetical protein